MLDPCNQLNVVYVPTRGTLKSLMTVIARRFPCNLGIIEGLSRNGENFPLRSTRYLWPWCWMGTGWITAMVTR